MPFSLHTRKTFQERNTRGPFGLQRNLDLFKEQGMVAPSPPFLVREMLGTKTTRHLEGVVRKGETPALSMARSIVSRPQIQQKT